MGTDEPENPETEGAALSRLYDLADGIACDIANLTPDWCEIAEDARELAEAAAEKCRCLRKNLTR
jgi:hypothetical protein